MPSALPPSSLPLYLLWSGGFITHHWAPAPLPALPALPSLFSRPISSHPQSLKGSVLLLLLCISQVYLEWIIWLTVCETHCASDQPCHKQTVICEIPLPASVRRMEAWIMCKETRSRIKLSIGQTTGGRVNEASAFSTGCFDTWNSSVGVKSCLPLAHSHFMSLVSRLPTACIGAWKCLQRFNKK